MARTTIASSSSLGKLWVNGADIDWPGLYRCHSARRIILPTYAFQRERYWLEPKGPETPRTPPTARDHEPAPALQTPYGHRLQSPLKDIQFESRIGVSAWAMLGDHRVYDQIVVPGAWHLASVLAAAREVYGSGTLVLRDVFFPQALVLGEEEIRAVRAPGTSTP
jgi:acyl transferase domain-containing protein